MCYRVFALSAYVFSLSEKVWIIFFISIGCIKILLKDIYLTIFFFYLFAECSFWIISIFRYRWAVFLDTQMRLGVKSLFQGDLICIKICCWGCIVQPCWHFYCWENMHLFIVLRDFLLMYRKFVHSYNLFVLRVFKYFFFFNILSWKTIVFEVEIKENAKNRHLISQQI